ncbi:phage major capsid protein [Streptomyces sp. AM 3-1-1]|uniref:phage major capsid protein n=1 Tax=Streptomyces sp. AM 3-1-1 TaxID=3028711 RepID=UPI0023B9AF29|nr:phage major capsid protein [Streptomyces sp. AM 3-1-1]WEH30125.1 phage major capsid protein [Streptomyces sp. AM 3-1-1]
MADNPNPEAAPEATPERAASFPTLEAVRDELRRLISEGEDQKSGDFSSDNIKSVSGTRHQKTKYVQALTARARELKAREDALHGSGEMDGWGQGSHEVRGGSYGTKGLTTAQYSRQWAQETAQRLTKALGGRDAGTKALTSGSIDTVGMVRTGFYTMPVNPTRVLDLIPARSIPSNEFEYLKQTVRTNNAAATPDSTLKPTSVFTVTSVSDRARVYAHLSQKVPLRLFADHRELEPFLTAELERGVVDALDADVVSGATGGENVVGILEVSGTTATAFSSTVAQTLRKALTASQVAHENPTAWVLHPEDAEELDTLLTADGSYVGSSGKGAPGSFSYKNVFGDVPVVVSTSVPAGTAILGDWAQSTLYVRENTRLDVDTSGPELFPLNLAMLRSEGRFGFAVNRPSAFRVVSLST